jgi:hypothetical protein
MGLACNYKRFCYCTVTVSHERNIYESADKNSRHKTTVLLVYNIFNKVVSNLGYVTLNFWITVFNKWEKLWEEAVVGPV